MQSYKGLKESLDDILSAPHAVYVPTQLSLTSSNPWNQATDKQSESQVPRSGSMSRRRRFSDDHTAQEVFFLELESEVNKVSLFAAQITSDLREQVHDLARKANEQVADEGKEEMRRFLTKEAKRIGDEYLELEKFVNLNYVAIHKILKKHDKLVPLAPCGLFYKSHISKHPWVRGEHHDIERLLHKASPPRPN
jgi:SPX domain protein involved in polyphosphate accumulation